MYPYTICQVKSETRKGVIVPIRVTGKSISERVHPKGDGILTRRGMDIPCNPETIEGTIVYA